MGRLPAPSTIRGSKRSAPARPPETRIGISGWTYAPWRGVFFPEGLAQREELAYAARRLASIEINGTFYSLQRAASFRSWREQTPGDFVFSVKAPRFITHIKRLREVEVPLANFFASGVLGLEEKLGPLLWQLPPSFVYDAGRLERFFALLPRDTAAAAALARRHDDHVRDPWLRPGPPRPLRHALEIRHESFRRPEFIDLLRRNEIALVVADTAGKWPHLEDLTADFVYVRLHGAEVLYASGYTEPALKEWARKIRLWRAGRNPSGARLTAPAAPPRPGGRSVYVYFDNDVKVKAPYDAMRLAHRLGLGPEPEEPSRAAPRPEPVRTRWPGFPRRVTSPGSRSVPGAPARRRSSSSPARRAPGAAPG